MSILEDEVYLKRAETLKDKVRQLISNQAKGTAVELLELVDDIQRLGMGYLFEGEIRAALDSIKDVKMEETDLHQTALRFRLFRQHGFKISQGEDIMDEAKAFARVHLKNAKGNVDSILARLVNHALDLPLNLGIVRLEARWYIDLYEKRKNANPIVLELAKLDYNMVQATHLNDAVDMTRWWNDLGLSKKLTFARDRLVESFLWSVGIQYEPQYKYCREGITKLIILITTIDDVYDVYSTYEEAKLFTEAVERWDINTLDELPDYMRICFFALYNTINQIAYNTLKEHGLNVLPYLKKTV
ncbi:Isoprene synthase [Thalictrum thalictroides]|uniref:Isoprene synthase n=1 Tax=Thalictrum thalictroides TaxID=46969 RepID=A0A7J6UYN1_THATH|nr:Isoprene synthase [Thalictrum thalictroides]